MAGIGGVHHVVRGEVGRNDEQAGARCVVELEVAADHHFVRQRHPARQLEDVAERSRRVTEAQVVRVFLIAVVGMLLSRGQADHRKPTLRQLEVDRFLEPVVRPEIVRCLDEHVLLHANLGRGQIVESDRLAAAVGQPWVRRSDKGERDPVGGRRRQIVRVRQIEIPAVVITRAHRYAREELVLPGQLVGPVLVANEVRIQPVDPLERPEPCVGRRSDLRVLRRSIGLLEDRVELRSTREGVSGDEPAGERLDGRFAGAEDVPGDAGPGCPIVPVGRVLHLVDRDRGGEVRSGIRLRRNAGVEVIPADAEIDRKSPEPPLVLRKHAAVEMDCLEIARRTIRDGDEIRSAVQRVANRHVAVERVRL